MSHVMEMNRRGPPTACAWGAQRRRSGERAHLQKRRAYLRWRHLGLARNRMRTVDRV